MRKSVKCFGEVLDSGRAHTVLDAGLRVIEVSKIKGSVDKCGELDDRFRYIRRRDRGERSRRYRIEEAQKQYAFFPPIDVYLHAGEYFVVDGHRRVSSALHMGIEFIDAHVREFIHQDDLLAMSGALSRRRFETQTGLKSISLTYEYGYRILLDDILHYPEGTEVEQKVRNWYTMVYLPASSCIEDSELPGVYQGLQTGDIYVLIVDFYRKFMGGIPENTSFESLRSGFSFAHHVQQGRLLRMLPFRVIHFLLFRRRDL